MASVDFPKVIQAAAASSLGVLSLIILAVSLLAYAFFKGSGDRTKVAVFAAMLLAAIGFGVSVVREGEDAATASPSKPAEIAAPVISAPVISATATATTPAPVAGGDPSGAWRDDDGFTYALKLDGKSFSYRQFLDGAPSGSGTGTMTGRDLRYTYVDDRTRDTGTCTGRLSADGARIDGKCGSAGREWGFAIRRDASVTPAGSPNP